MYMEVVLKIVVLLITKLMWMLRMYKSNVNIPITYNFSNNFKLSVGTDLVSILKKNV